MFLPKDVDLSKNLQGKFGCVEFEKAAIEIINYLKDDTKKLNLAEWLGNDGTGWEKKFKIHTIPNIDPTLFAMLCDAGWLTHTWFPKGTFTVSKDFIKRLQE